MVFHHTWFWILNHIIISQCYILPSIHDISSNNKLTWSQAESYCLSTYSTHLLSIHDQSILTNIKQDLTVNNDNIVSNNFQPSNDLKFWIGLLQVETDETSANFGIWIDGTNFDFDFTIYIEEDYSDTNITSITSHPQYITLQIIDNELIYSISDGTQSQFWICNDEPTTQSTPAYSIQLSIFTVIGILATLCCCLMLLLYAISMKAMKSNTPEPPKQCTQYSNSNNDHLSVRVEITPENSSELPPNPPVSHKVVSASLTSIASHSPRKSLNTNISSTSPSLRSIMSEKIIERVESQSPRNWRKRLGIEDTISNVSAATSVKSGYIETNMVNNKHANNKNSKRTFLFNTNSIQSNNSDDECVEGYIKTEKVHMENNVSFDKNVIFKINNTSLNNNVSLNDNVSYNDTLDLDESKLSIIPSNNSTQISEYNIQISRHKKRVEHKTKNSDGYMLNDRNANEINEKDPLDLGNNEFIVRENTEPKLRLKDLEHSTSIGTIGTVLDQYKAKTNDVASQNDSLYLD